MFDYRYVSVLNEELWWYEGKLTDADIKGFSKEVTHELISKVWVMKQKYIKRGIYEKNIA